MIALPQSFSHACRHTQPQSGFMCTECTAAEHSQQPTINVTAKTVSACCALQHMLPWQQHSPIGVHLFSHCQHMFVRKLALLLSIMNKKQQLSVLVCKQSSNCVFLCTRQAALSWECVQVEQQLSVHMSKPSSQCPCMCAGQGTIVRTCACKLSNNCVFLSAGRAAS